MSRLWKGEQQESLFCSGLLRKTALVKSLTFLTVLTCLCTSRFAYAVSFGTMGARAMGMGNAFTAVSDDLSSVYWNPAGLGFLNSISLTMPYGNFAEDRDNTSDALERFQDNLFSSNLPSLVASFKDENMVVSGDNNIGFIFGMPGFALSLIERDFMSISPTWTDREMHSDGKKWENGSFLQFSGLETSRYVFSICYGQKQSGYFLGVNANYVEYSSYTQQIAISGLDKIAVSALVDQALHGNKHNGALWSFDAGLSLFFAGYRLGITARDVNSPQFEVTSDRNITFNPQYRFGFAMPLAGGLVAAVDYDLNKNKLYDSQLEEQQLAMGLEMLFAGGKYRLRAGGNKNTAERGSPFHYSMGGGFQLGIFLFDSAASLNQKDKIWNWSATVTVVFG